MTSPNSTSSVSGIWFALATVFFFSINTSIAKIFVSYIQPVMLAGLLFLGAGLGLLLFYLMAKGVRKPDAGLQKSDLGWFMAATISGGVLAPILLMIGLTQVTASTASLLLNFESVFTAILAWTVFREPWHWRVLLGIVIITAGGAVLSGADPSRIGLSLGTLAVLGTCLLWALDGNLTRKIAIRDSLQVAMLRNLMAGLIDITIALSIGQSFPPPIVILQVFGAGLLCYGLAIWCFTLSLRYLGAAKTGAYLSLVPFAGAAFATLLLQEPVTESLLAAAVLMAIGAGFCLSDLSGQTGKP
ncbi:hypothetical protein BST81_21705 [Leptolyngbya sp. 'hensonii']|uniref:DMT family transporter n=1 Tax=Leptolyngbya sp. 'hensonii' TaxID=1922337 RepID=UPI00094F8DD7|nr:DMT family transporter [Leptolyngbya sp. 'hensonii']OLP16223.1 hypothetical protein BST81_21705 [Leptolyngbya sp. 'hensonii']